MCKCWDSRLSNVSVETDIVLLLPENPDESAKKIRKYIYHKLKKNVSIIISDTFGRPFRKVKQILQ